MTNVPCPVCGVDADRRCLALDLLPLPTPHVERTETTPLHDAVADAQANRGAA